MKRLALLSLFLVCGLASLEAATPTKFYRKLFWKKVVWINANKLKDVDSLSYFPGKVIGKIYHDRRQVTFANGAQAQCDSTGNQIRCILVQDSVKCNFFFTSNGHLIAVLLLVETQKEKEFTPVLPGTPDHDQYIADFRKAFPQLKKVVRL